MKKFYHYAPIMGMCLLVALACILRILLIWSHWPTTNSDESFVDLMALHVMKKGEWPIFFYGQGYMGTLQAYLGALLFHIFGVSAFTVRLGLVLFFALFLIVTYYLTSLLFSKKFALLIVALMGLGSSPVITTELFANGGYAETKLFAVLIYLLAGWLALTSRTDAAQLANVWRRRIAWATLGLVAGLAIWSDLLIMPCLLTAGILLWLFCRHELRSWSGIGLLGCFLVAIIPIVIYNLSARPGYDSLHALAGSMHYPAVPNSAPFLQQILQALLISLPMATGASPICAVPNPMHRVNSIAAFFAPAPYPQQCIAIQGGWAAAAILLWSFAVITSALPLYWTWKRLHAPLADWSPQERQRAIRLAAQLLLLMSAAITFVLYAISSPAAVDPHSTSRYLACLLLALPAVLWPLWHGFGRLNTSERWKSSGTILLIVRYGLLLAVVLVFVWGTIRIGAEVPAAQAAYARQERLTQDLLHMDATRIYSDYWTCARLIFQSQEQIMCASLDAQLNADNDRYLPYRAAVRSASHPAYVFSSGSSQANAFAQRMLSTGKHYQWHTFEGYVVYTL
ncbi:MAG TPA: hypothetical protein VHZ51_30425 [Ktedonobacteraceae bacterium]|nr:hypothetical protein [Ktedonobacteraceae bacterium]